MRGLFPVPPVLSGRVLCLRPLTSADTEDLRRLTRQEIVYRYLPTFLFEKKYEPSEALGLLVNELLNHRGTEIITASTMVENLASARVLRKNGFILVNHAVDEDWGYAEPTPADKWIR